MPISRLRGSDIWTWRRTIDGVEQQRSTKTTDKKLAQQIAAGFEAEFVKTAVLEGNTPSTLGQLITQYLEAKAGLPSEASMRMHFNKFKALHGKQTKAIKLIDVQQVINADRAKGNKESTVALTTRYWNGLQNWAVEHKMVPAPKLEPIRGIKGKDRYLTHEEEQRLLKALAVPDTKMRGLTIEGKFERQDNYDLAIMLLDLGCRFNEATDVTWSQVNWREKTVFIKRSKGGNSSTHLMTPRLEAVLKRRLAEAENEDHVFPTKLADRKDGKWMTRAVKRAALSKANGAVTVHSLRHTYANRMLSAGLQLPEVQQLLGHKNIATTMQYIHVQTTETARKALAAQLLNVDRDRQTSNSGN
ncbi:tyrosine-type recombinase/integrase [Variovorax sp. RB2P76]